MDVQPQPQSLANVWHILAPSTIPVSKQAFLSPKPVIANPECATPHQTDEMQDQAWTPGNEFPSQYETTIGDELE
jgi:hypothetical protein